MKRMIPVAALLLLLAGGAGAAEGGFSGRGMIRPEADIILAARTGGLVTAVPLIEGDAAGTGDAVVVLDDSEEAARAALAKVDLEIAELNLKKVKDGPRPEDLERAQALHEESRAGLALAEKTLSSDLKLAEGGFLSELGRQRSERSLEAARAQAESRRLDLVILAKGPRAEDVRLAEIEVERRRAQLDAALRDQARRRIGSSREGKALVARIWVEKGQWVDAGKTVAELVYVDRLRIELDLAGPGALSIARGAKATVKSPAFPGIVLEGVVERVAPVVDPASGTVRVVVTAANPGRRVRPGVEAEVDRAVIRPDRPVLDKGSRVVRQVEDGVTRYVVRAGATGKYLRVGEPEAALLSLMDGTRTLEEIRTSFVARTKEVLDLRDIAGFLARMRQAEVVEPTAEGRNLLLVEKARQGRKEKMFAGKIGSLFFMRVKLLDPDAILTRLEPYTRFIFTKAFLVFAAILVATATAVLVSRSDEVFGRVKNFLLISAGSGADLFVIWITALCIVSIHETAHGVACKHWGGEVHEMGFLLMFFQPCFYCNVNDAWTFESRAQKLWVTAAGGFVEVLLGSTCVLIWAVTEPGSPIHGMTYLVFMLSLSMTLLCNMNPLIKLDGYYLLADLLKVENLKDRSGAQLSWIFRGKILRRPAAPVAATRREAWILTIYGLASSAYQALLVLTILTLLVGAASGADGPGLGTLALLGFVAWMILKRPLLAAKEAVMQSAQAQVGKHGARGALVRVGVALAVVVGVSLVIPWKRTSDAASVAEPWRMADVRSPLEGTVESVLVAEGARVKAGDPLVRVSAPGEEALARVERETAGRLRRDALRRRSMGDASGADVTEKDAQTAELRAAGIEERLKSSVIGSPIDGVILTRRLEEIERGPVRREGALLKVGDISRLRFHAVMDARKVGPVHEGMDAVVRIRAFPGEALAGKVVSVSRQAIDAKDDRLQEVTGSHWEVVVETDNPGLRVLPGMTGETRVLLERTSLASAFAQGVRGTFRSDLLK